MREIIQYSVHCLSGRVELKEEYLARLDSERDPEARRLWDVPQAVLLSNRGAVIIIN
jgi:hypothetical protein